MIVFCTTVDDSNIVKIVIGPETQALNAINGLINIDLDQIMEVIRNVPASKNIIQISFCNDEDSVQKFLNQNSIKSNMISKDIINNQKPKKVKCPTCYGDALIDSDGNIHPCESCIKIEAYKKGLEKGKSESTKKKKPQKRKKTSTRKTNQILMEKTDNDKFENDKHIMD